MQESGITRREFIKSMRIFAIAPLALSLCACTGGSGSSSSSSSSSSSKAKSETCHICNKTFTDAENMRSIRYTNMCVKCNETRETLTEVRDNLTNN